jgi:phosphatidate cytidylyltransferase
MLLFFGMLIYVLSYVMLKKNTVNVSEMLTFYALFVYIVGCFSSIVLVRYGNKGGYLYMLVFLGAWICDTFAYFTGKFFGKHKLIPEISPKKTVEGSIGGIVFTVISFVIFGLIVNLGFDADISYIKLCIFAVVLSIVSQFGDLIASTVKRQYDIKDYGNLFPGHGGILDRFDGVMLTAPTLFILNMALSWF